MYFKIHPKAECVEIYVKMAHSLEFMKHIGGQKEMLDLFENNVNSIPENRISINYWMRWGEGGKNQLIS